MRKGYQKYLIGYRDKGLRECSIEVEGRPVVIPRFKRFGFFVSRWDNSIHPTGNAVHGPGWRVSEVITGRSICGAMTFPTIAEAIKAASSRIRQQVGMRQIFRSSLIAMCL